MTFLSNAPLLIVITLGEEMVMLELNNPHPASGSEQQTATTAAASRRVRLGSQSTRHLRARS
jgi:hypothetical protein